MKKFNPALILLLYLVSTLSYAQKLNLEMVDLPISKTAKKKGMYVNTTLTPDGNIQSYVSYDLKKGELGFDVLTVSPSGKPLETRSEVAGKSSSQEFNVEIPDPGTIEAPGEGVRVLRLVTSTGILGKLKIEEGGFKAKYATSVEYGPYLTTYTPVFRGYKFKDDETTESDMRLNIYAAHCKEGDDMEKAYTIIEGLVDNTVGYFDKNATIAFMGRDARIPDKDAENGANVVMSGQFDGKTKSFINIKETVLEYNQSMVTNGYDGKGNRSVLVSTINAPSSSAKLNRWQAKGVPFMTYLTMDIEGNVIDNVTFKSKSIRGSFGIFGSGDSHWVLGSINEGHNGYFRWDVGKVTHFQIVKIRDGKVEKQEVFSMDQLESMLVLPDGTKKGKLKYKDIKFTDLRVASNGDLLAFANGAAEYLIYQFDENAKLKAVYQIEKVGGFDYGIQTMESGDDLFVVFRFQNGYISRGIKKSVTRGYGYMKNVNFSRVDELMTYARIVKLSPAQMKCSSYVDFIPDVILGEDALFKGSEGQLILPVRDVKNNYKMAVIR